MDRSEIKVIKKSSKDIQPVVLEQDVPEKDVPEKKNVKSFSKNAINTIEHNIKGWIDELQVRKNDEMIQAHSFLGST